MHPFARAFMEELREVLRHPALMVTGVLMPLFWAAALIGIFSTGLMRGVPVGLVDLDNSAQSREMIRELESIPSIDFIGFESAAAAKDALAASRVYVLAVFPPDWSAKSAGSRSDSAVELYLNRSFYAIAVTLEADIKTALAAIAAQKTAAAAAKTGGGFSGAAERIGAMKADVLIAGNSTVNYAAYLLATLIPGVTALACILTCVGAVTREWRRKTLAAWTAEGSVAARLLGRLGFWALLYGVYALGYVAWFAGYSGWAPQGSLLIWCAGAVLLMTAMAAVALLFSVLAPSWILALSAAICYIAPTFPFTGFSFPLDSMDRGAQVLSNIFPLTWFLRVQSSQWVLASPLDHSLGLLAAMGLFTAVPLVLGLLIAPARFAKLAAKEAPEPDKTRAAGGFWSAAFETIRLGVMNKDTFAIFVAASAFYLVFYAWPYANQQITAVDTVVVDLDNTAASRAVVQRLKTLTTIEVLSVTSDEAAAKRMYQTEAAAAVVIIPHRFEEFALAGKKTAIRVTANGAFPVKARAVASGVAGIMQELSARSTALNLMRAGASAADIKAMGSRPVALTDQNLYNTLSGYAGYIVPVVMPVIVHAVLLMGLMMVLGGWLAAPNAPRILVSVLSGARGTAAFFTAFWLFGMFWMLYAMGPDFVLFDYTALKNPVATLVVSAVYIAAVTAFGTAVTLLLNSNAYGAQFFVLISAPAVFLSGAVYPAFDFNAFAAAVAWLLPTSPGITAMVAAAQNGASLVSVMPQVAHLAVLTAGYLAAACVLARRRAAERGIGAA